MIFHSSNIFFKIYSHFIEVSIGALAVVILSTVAIVANLTNFVTAVSSDDVDDIEDNRQR